MMVLLHPEDAHSHRARSNFGCNVCAGFSSGIIKSGCAGADLGCDRPTWVMLIRQGPAKHRQLRTAARELRDRWMERVDADPSLLMPAGKYEVSRALVLKAPASEPKPRAALPSIAA